MNIIDIQGNPTKCSAWFSIRDSDYLISGNQFHIIGRNRSKPGSMRLCKSESYCNFFYSRRCSRRFFKKNK